jgi:hypothetical protein
MPFTLSHAAAALPFRKLKPIWPALVIGTFAPDFQYFLNLSDESRRWHDFPEVLTVALPVGLLVFWAFEYFVKVSATELLPAEVQRRLPEVRQKIWFTNWSRWPAVVGWIVVGLATHIFWDSFTHSTSWSYEHWAWLHRPMAVPLHDPMPLYKLLQHGSSVLGLLGLMFWLAGWYRSTSPRADAAAQEMPGTRKLTIVLTMGAMALLCGYPVAVKRFASFDPPIEQKYFVITLFEAIALLVCLQMLFYGVVRTLAADSASRAARRINE